MKSFLAGILEIVLNLWIALSDVVEDFLDLIISRLNNSSLYVIMGDEDNPTEIPVSRLGEFILDDGRSHEDTPEEKCQISSYPLSDALDFSKKPSESEIKSISPGDKVLLISNYESFWVTVESITQEGFQGTIEGNPEKSGYKSGSTIEFADHHIFQISNTAQAI